MHDCFVPGLSVVSTNNMITKINPRLGAMPSETRLARPTVALLIPSKNRHDCLQRSLPSWQIAAKAANADIIICDQSLRVFSAPDVTVLHRPQLNGLPAARNELLANCQADVVIFVDDDTDIAPDLLTTVQILAQREITMMAWGPVIEVRSWWIRCAHRLVQLGVFADPRRRTHGASDQRSSLLFGCCFAVRRNVACAIGFDARRSGYALGEDADFFRRLNAPAARIASRFSRHLHATHRKDGQDRSNPWQRGVDKGAFLRWWARQHGSQNPMTILHLGLALAAAASGFGQESASWRGVLAGLRQPTNHA
jgi:glycosyltransferase involved in cell wall biosynthesis